MIRAEQIPPEVMKAWHTHCADNLATTYEEALAAALAAWPGMQRRPSGAYYAIVWDAHLVLPLPDKGAPTQGDACNG